MKYYLLSFLIAISIASNAQNAAYFNLGTNFFNLYGGVSIGADMKTNLRFNLSANFIQKDIDNLQIRGFQLEPTLIYKFNSESEARPIIGLGAYLFDPLSRSDKEINLSFVDVGLVFSIGILERDKSVSFEYSRGLVDLFDGNKSQYGGIIFRVPISHPFD